MQGLNLKGKNVAGADLVAILSCIKKIAKLSGIEEIILESDSRVNISLLVEIVKKMDQPVIMEVNLMFMIIYHFFLLINISNISHYIFLNKDFLFKKKYIALDLYIKNYGWHFQVY